MRNRARPPNVRLSLETLASFPGDHELHTSFVCLFAAARPRSTHVSASTGRLRLRYSSAMILQSPTLRSVCSQKAIWAPIGGPQIASQREQRRSAKQTSASRRGKLSKDDLERMVEEATVDAYDESEQVCGFYTMLENDLELPFNAVLGAEVVERIDLTDAILLWCAGAVNSGSGCRFWICPCRASAQRMG